MPALANALASDEFIAPEPQAVTGTSPGTQTTALLIAGHSGQIGSELLRQIDNRQPELLAREIYLQVAGRVNRSEVVWSSAQNRGEERWARTADDWPKILRHILAGAPVPRLFVDCTAGSNFVDHYPELLRHGIGIVTPNKLANSGSQTDYTRLKELAHHHGVPYCYETTVGAALPILGPIADLVRAGDRVRRIEALVSGTLSFILNRVNNGERFSAAVRNARARGYTEPYPATDLAGTDSGRKLLILLREAGWSWEPEQVKVQSLVPEELAAESDAERFLAGLAAHDTAWAEHAEAAHRRSLRLVYLARFDGHSAQVGVTHVAAGDPFALLAPGENLVRIWTDRYQPVPLSIAGPGAGPEPTAAGVLTDILKAARELLHSR
ncbi:MAG: aspartate kinase [Gammaproteobacteria bacterium]|nr:aspartate kinase [Gammaproteobacteria bacterium]MDE2024706.1 aspartate kinase [Gammaproteobacteria bacterium]